MYYEYYAPSLLPAVVPASGFARVEDLEHLVACNSVVLYGLVRTVLNLIS